MKLPRNIVSVRLYYKFQIIYHMSSINAPNVSPGLSAQTAKPFTNIGLSDHLIAYARKRRPRFAIADW